MTGDKTKVKRITRWINLIVWSVLGFSVAGLLPAMYFHKPTISMALAAVGVIPYASKIARPVRSGLVAGLLGTISGISMVNALMSGTALSQQAAADIAVRYVGATGAFCVGVGVLFGYLAQQRKRQAEDDWKRHQ